MFKDVSHETPDVTTCRISPPMFFFARVSCETPDVTPCHTSPPQGVHARIKAHELKRSDTMLYVRTACTAARTFTFRGARKRSGGCLKEHNLGTGLRSLSVDNWHRPSIVDETPGRERSDHNGDWIVREKQEVCINNNTI